MTSRLRVTFCLMNGGVGGTELNAVRTAELMDRDRFDLEVIALDDYPPLRQRYKDLGIPFEVLETGSFKSPGAVRAGWRLARHLHARKVDVFHAHDFPGNVLGVPWARLAGVPAVIASRRWWMRDADAGQDLACRVSFRLAHAVIANTPRVARRTADEGVDRDKIRLVPNFLDEETFTAPPSELLGELRDGLGIDEDARIVGIVAQLRPEKDHATLLRAAARLAGRHPDVHFVLVGEGDRRQELEELRRELHLEGRVHLAGLRHGVGNLHHMFDVSVLCSRSEAFSNSILEAMAAGNPVVATAVGGNPDAVADGETGLLTPVGDAGSLATALHRLLSDTDHARRLGEEGRERARRIYTPQSALQALESVYAELLSGRLRARTGRVPVAA